jgi:very-short-patch-repair endonuclease
VLDDPTSMPSRTVDRTGTIFHSGAVPVCGNCGRHHPTAGAVKDCYARSSERGAAEARGRRQVKGDGANEVTANFLRATMPASEAALWRRLQPTFEGYQFAAQVLMLGYSLDFYCHPLALAIEVDGGSHRGRNRADQLREDDLRANHVDVVRVADELVLGDIGGRSTSSVVADPGDPGRRGPALPPIAPGEAVTVRIC